MQVDELHGSVDDQPGECNQSEAKKELSLSEHTNPERPAWSEEGRGKAQGTLGNTVHKMKLMWIMHYGFCSHMISTKFNKYKRL